VLVKELAGVLDVALFDNGAEAISEHRPQPNDRVDQNAGSASMHYGQRSDPLTGVRRTFRDARVYSSTRRRS
jgi:hypothetical protein